MSVPRALPAESRDTGGPSSLATRLLGGGYRGARRVAGATGIDRAVETAAEEAIVRAVESPAVERALARVLRGPAVIEAVGDALASPAVEAALVETLDSQLLDRIWDRLLTSDELQRLVERIAEAPEVRSAIAAQGVGLLDDLRRVIRKAVRRLDDVVERFVRRLLRRPQRSGATDRAGAVSRALAVALDVALLDGALILLSAAIAFLVKAVFGGGGGVSTPAVAAGVGVWILAGVAYLTFFWGAVGQTPGMRFLGTRLLTAGDPGGIGPRRAWRRFVGTVLAAIPLGLGFIGILTGADRRGFPDRFAGTAVAYVPDAARAPSATVPRDAVSDG
jgi:uncharacterized RDD family membrane protein YckC